LGSTSTTRFCSLYTLELVDFLWHSNVRTRFYNFMWEICKSKFGVSRLLFLVNSVNCLPCRTSGWANRRTQKRGLNLELSQYAAGVFFRSTAAFAVRSSLMIWRATKTTMRNFMLVIQTGAAILLHH
jgi:hypothetical protein